MCFHGLTLSPCYLSLSSFSLAEVLGSRLMWLEPVLWSVFIAVALCFPVFPVTIIVYTVWMLDVCIPFLLDSYGELTLATSHVYAVHPGFSRVPASSSSHPFLSSRQAALLPSPVLTLRVGAGLGGLDVWRGCGCCSSLKAFSVSVLGTFLVSILANTSCLVCLGLGMFCLHLWVYTFTVVGVLVAFYLPFVWWFVFHWWFPLSDVLTVYPCGSAFLVTWCLGYFAGLVVGALDIFWLDWTLCSFEVLPSRWCHLLTDLDG